MGEKNLAVADGRVVERGLDHPLADETDDLHVKINAIRPATDEELAYSHLHSVQD